MRTRTAVVAAVLALVAGACSFSKPHVLPPPADTGPAPIYVAVGASETTGVGSDQPLRDGWPRVFHRTALPAGSVFVNMGIPNATIAQALAEEASQALAARPNVITVWLNVNDMVAGVAPADYERQLEALVKTLRGNGRIRVLVANTPPLDQLPAYQAGRQLAALPGPDALRQLTDDYNAATGRVVQRQGALLVDLFALGMSFRAAGTEATMVARDGFHPSTAGHAAVAEAFAKVMRDAGPLTVTG